MKWHRAVAVLATSVGPWLVNAVEEGLNGDYVDRCPKACSELGADPSTWPQVHKIEDLKGCDEPVLLSFNVQNLLTEPTTQITIQTCSRAASQSFGSAIAVNKDVQGGPSIANNCGAKTNRVNATAQLVLEDNTVPLNQADLSSVVGELAKYVEDGAACGTTIIFAKSGSAVLGLYAGADVFTPTLAATINQFGEEAQSGRFVLQICEANSTTATTIGLVAGDIADLSKIQDTVKTWANNQCLSDNKDSSSSKIGVQIGVLTSTAGGNSTTLAARRPHLDRRADCRDIQVISGDGCASLASKCGISGDDFTKYNPKTDLCSTLMPKQYVCCSAGTLPDHTPQPGSDGSCYEYTVQEGDGCWAIGDAFGIDQTAIENYNKQTWGWGGCGALQKGQKICLSKGSPPFPDSVEGVTCGPTVPGTEKPTDGTNWADLNPCPLNSCCDVWGFCGTTAEFCTPTPADTGAPGTAKPGTNGCISNCGMDIVNNGSPPSTFRKVAYFEGWNGARPCLTMDASQIDSGEYNTVHFAFATLAADWSVTIEDESKKQFEAFKNLKNVKKVLSFGGWTFSTDPATFQRFRDATTSANRNTVAANAVNFMKDNGLDGLDFDWEYPGAPDIPGIPAGSTAEGLNYMKFLTVVKNQLPSGATLSIALPASYWYLKQYPVNLMQSVVDYFVYMTYDFHGQWDVDSKWSVEGCETGNCVRSHINKTETKNAMVMITKAGVTANKIVIGVSSYARSFRLSDPGCLGVMCKYQGDKNHSEAYQGKCTGTSGYISNAELEEIKAGKSSYPNVKYFFDQDSESDILVYGTSSSVDWAAYMSADTKKSRASWVSGLNFGGTTDWAVDLMTYQPALTDPDPPSSDPDDVCDIKQRKYSSNTMPDGEFMNWIWMDPTYPDVDRTYWVTIVNLTPYNFKLEVREKPYQIDPYDFGDIPPGRSRPNMVHYGGGNPVDSNGHFYYVLEGTNEHKEFVVKATTHIPDDYPMRTVFDLGGMGLGSREYSNPWMHGGVTLVITGSEEYGFVTSLNHGPGNWMHRIKDVIKDRDVRHVIFPGTHDSGMSYISGKILSGGSSVNTQTQNLNMYDQLRCGARWFDLRIASIHQTTPNEGSYEFWAAHVSDELAEVVLGNTGESLDDIISEINHFTAENPGELIFLRMKYLVGFRKVPSLGPIRWGSDINSGILGDFISHLRGLHNRCTNWDTSKQFHEQPIGNFLGGNGGGGCVIVILDGQIEKSIESVNDGIYSVSHIRFWDDWSQQGFTDSMASKEISDWKTVNRPGGGGRSNDDQIFINQWLPSAAPLDIQGFGLQAIAVIPTNPTLYWAGVNNISPETFPNVLMVDYIGEVTMNDNAFDHLSAEMYAVSIGLNLFTLSENCNINPKRPPLYPPVTKNAKALFSISSTETEPAKLAFEPWTGVIFANGTVLDETPAGFSWDGPLVTKDGVTFHNVSALTTASETPNPLARQNGTLSSNTTQPLRFRRASLQ